MFSKAKQCGVFLDELLISFVITNELCKICPNWQLRLKVLGI